ncbi:MAG: RNA polymerase sigma factor [Planctomycetota bacterium]
MDPASWQRLIDAANCASLLVAIETRLGPVLRARLQPEDILQESLLQAWRDRAGAQFQSPRAFRAWLLTIIDHRIRDAAESAATLKRGGTPSAPSRPPGSPAVLEPSGSTTPSRVAAYREQAAVMAEALQGVPQEWRDVVHLRLFHQLTLDQVAEQLGLSLAMVRTRLRRGAEIYRQRLRAGGIGRSTLRSTISGAPQGTDPASLV